MAKNPDQRYVTPTDMAVAARSAVTQPPTALPHALRGAEANHSETQTLALPQNAPRNYYPAGHRRRRHRRRVAECQTPTRLSTGNTVQRRAAPTCPRLGRPGATSSLTPSRQGPAQVGPKRMANAVA